MSPSAFHNTFPLVPMGSSLLGLRMIDPPLGPPSIDQNVVHLKSHFLVSKNPVPNFRTPSGSKKKNAVNSGHYVPPTAYKGRSRNPLGPK